MKKVVLNVKPGAFDLSEEAVVLYARKKQMTLYVNRSGIDNVYYTKSKKERISDNDSLWNTSDISREDNDLISVIETLGKKAENSYSALAVVEIDDNVSYSIEVDDGRETVIYNFKK